MEPRIQSGLRLPAKLHRKLSRYALDKGRALNDIVCEAIELWWLKKVPLDDRRFYAKSSPSTKATRSKRPTTR